MRRKETRLRNHARAVYAVALAFRVFQKTLKPEKSTKIGRREEETIDFSRIRCPLCKWRPGKSNRWYCANCHYPEYFYAACGTSWNTFSTRGLCPGCSHQWRWTTCFRCQRWSRHLNWYE